MLQDGYVLEPHLSKSICVCDFDATCIELLFRQRVILNEIKLVLKLCPLRVVYFTVPFSVT